MKHSIINLALIVTLFSLFWSGCKNPGPVELFDEQDDSKLIEMKSVGITSDSLYIQSGTDSTGLLGSENSKYRSKMIYAGIRYGLSPVADSLVQAEAIFMDTTNPVFSNGKIIAYPSFDAGMLIVDGDTLNKYQRRIRMPMSGSDTAIGYIYKLKKRYAFLSEHSYRWRGSGSANIDSLDIPCTTPPEIVITEISSMYIGNNEPLHIKWNCANPTINLIISREGGLQRRTWAPVLHLKIRNTKGEITIPTKIMEILPTRNYKNFLFSFISETRFTTTVGSYGDVLIQTASIHNIPMNVQP